MPRGFTSTKIVALPAPTAVTSPFWSTVATLVLSDPHVPDRVSVCPLLRVDVAVNRTVCPMKIV